jgi:hypothetical protein
MKHINILAVIVAFPFAVAHGQESPPLSDKADRAAKKLPDWSERDELPRLNGQLMRPIRKADEFEIGNSSVRHPKNPQPVEPPTEPPYATDDAAVRAAMNWLRDHFGELPEGVTLKATEVLHSSSGREKPEFDWDVGHTIHLRAAYRGIPTEDGAVIYIRGKSQIHGTIFLRRYTPMGMPRPVIEAAKAKDAWRRIVAARENPEEALKQFEAQAKPRLMFVWSSEANRDVQDSDWIVTPTWVLDDEELIMVDGHSGKPWFND